jgi:hypothetical protein
MHPFNRHATFVLAILSLVGAKSALAGGPVFHHHDKDASDDQEDHYKDEGEKPARAQVGRTVFKARALLAKDGVTDLEVTTGSFDTSSTPPGHLSEVHVKAFRLDGKHQFDKEFEHLRSGGGYARFSFPLPAPVKRRGGDDDDGDHDHGRAKDTRLEHGQLLKLHVEGKGLPSADEGEAEAKMETTVKYRPYLTVTSLHYPASASVKTAVEVSASVVEEMRDTGAHADCVLSVDGKPVDKAPGIWIDANGAVTCHLVYVFPVSGKHSIAVSMQNVAPGEYDSDGDTLSGSIQIDSPSVMAYYASAYDLTDTTLDVRDVFATDTSTVPAQQNITTTKRHTQSRSLTGTIRTAVNLPLKKVSYADQSDGTLLTSMTFVDVPADIVSAIVGNATYDSVATILRADQATGCWFRMNRYSNSTTGAGVTSVSWSFYGGDATYHSESYCTGVAPIFTCRGGDWTPNSPGKTTNSYTPWGDPTVSLGKTYGADAVVDDGTAYSGHPVMTLVKTIANSAPASVACSPSFPRVCLTSTASTTVVVGSAAFTPPL